MWSLCSRWVGVWYCLFCCYFACCFLVLLIVFVCGVVCLLMVMLDDLFLGGWVIVCCVVIACVACLFICGLLVWNLVRFGCGCLCSVCCFNWCELFCLNGCLLLVRWVVCSTVFYGFVWAYCLLFIIIGLFVWMIVTIVGGYCVLYGCLCCLRDYFVYRLIVLLLIIRNCLYGLGICIIV